MPPILITCLLCILPLTLGAAGSGGGLTRLVGNSPFAPVPVGAANAAGEATPIEFRGVFTDQGELFFSIFNPASKSSAWVGLNEPGHDFSVRSYDADKQTISAEFAGRTLSLALKKAPIVAGPPPPPGPAIAGVPAGGQPLPAAAPANEAQRLSNLAAEIRRRRAMRQQVTNPTNAAPAPRQQP